MDPLSNITPQQADGIAYLHEGLIGPSGVAAIAVSLCEVAGWDKPWVIWQGQGRAAVLDPDGNFRDPTVVPEKSEVTYAHAEYEVLVRASEAGQNN